MKQRIAVNGENKETIHGIANAFYANGPYGYQPVLECLCGYETGNNSTWEEAGQEFDSHLFGIGT